MMKFGREYKTYLNLAGASTLWKVKVSWAAPLDPESGMTVDLAVVDEQVAKAFTETSIADYNDILTALYSMAELINVSGQMKSLELINTQNLAWTLENKSVTRVYEFYFQNKYWTRLAWKNLDDIFLPPLNFVGDLKASLEALCHEIKKHNPSTAFSVQMRDEVSDIGLELSF